jgi:hypothetical protein
LSTPSFDTTDGTTNTRAEEKREEEEEWARRYDDRSRNPPLPADAVLIVLMIWGEELFINYYKRVLLYFLIKA